jgi:hypothetical protein
MDRRLLLPLLALAVLASLGPASARPAATGMGPRGFNAQIVRTAAAKTPSPLIDHGGAVLPTSKTYAIWWGPTGAFPKDEQWVIGKVLGGLDNSGYLATANQYLRGATATTAFQALPADPSPPPGRQPSVTTIVNEVANVLGTLAPDPNGIYFVFTSNFANGGACAWHSHGTIGTTTVQVAYVPNTDGVKACATGFSYQNYSAAILSVADSTAHEFMEAVTDPLGTAWYDKNGAEIGDKCNATVEVVTLGNGFPFPLQPEWSNLDNGCVIAPGTP